MQHTNSNRKEYDDRKGKDRAVDVQVSGGGHGRSTRAAMSRRKELTYRIHRPRIRNLRALTQSDSWFSGVEFLGP